MRLTTPVEYLKTRFVGHQTLYYPVTSSTQDIAMQAVKDGAREGTIAIADHQTAGRGRLGRKWLSSPDNSIMVSIILYPDIEHLRQLNMVAALAVAQSIEKLTRLKPVLKWPNDVLLEGKKVSGALIESDIQGERVGSAIVGIGLNVNLDTSSLAEISDTATSLKEMLGREVPRAAILEGLLCEFEEVYQELRHGQPVIKEWQRRLQTLGKEVLVKRGNEVWEGYAESVDKDGNLLLRRPDGTLSTIIAGDVTLKTKNY
jgi:BirA family biotin operon repressor/biotin-[acetyl-CoA-carboxylase] ligase